MTENAADKAVLRGKALLNGRLNVSIAALILFFGVSSIISSALSKPQENFLFEFRYMTMNGTVFTTLIALIIVVFGLRGMITGKRAEPRRLYFFRLCSAVTESVIAVVILMSFFPFVPDDPDLLNYESFCMHVIIPVLSVVSFLLDPCPVEFRHPVLRLNCAWLITLYAAVVITLILTGFIPQEKIPYSFLDFTARPPAYIVYFGCFVYSFTYILTVILSEWNRRIAHR